jgi:hypothetical protein
MVMYVLLENKSEEKLIRNKFLGQELMNHKKICKYLKED